MASIISASTTSTTALTLSGDTTGILELKTGATPTTALTIDGSQNVGIGTNSITPYFTNDRILSIAGGANGAELKLVNNTTGGAAADGGLVLMLGNDFYVWNTENSFLSFGTNNVERMRIDSSGVVGLGITTAGSNAGAFTQLQLGGTATANSRTTFFGQNNAAAGGIISNGYFDASNNLVYSQSSYGVCRLYLAGGDFRFENAASGTAGNNVTLTERMRITSGGDLIVAKTTTADATVGATMQNSGRIAGAMAASTNAVDTMTVYSTGAGLYRFYLGMGGTIYATSTTITGISDQRLKENIVDLPDGLDAVMALKPRKFDWKEGKGKNIKGDRGFIAQEFETVFPDMIETWKDPAPEGEEPYKGVNPNLIPTLVKAIQEQQAMIEELKQEVAALKASH